jgi:tetratricopeptide (TPR) repeat protein
MVVGTSSDSTLYPKGFQDPRLFPLSHAFSISTLTPNQGDDLDLVEHTTTTIDNYKHLVTTDNPATAPNHPRDPSKMASDQARSSRAPMVKNRVSRSEMRGAVTRSIRFLTVACISTPAGPREDPGRTSYGCKPNSSFSIDNSHPNDPPQITAEQLLREAQERQEAPFRAPGQNITDLEELSEYQGRKRKEFEERIRYSRSALREWMKYAQWEAGQNEFERARSVFERALDVDPRAVELWTRYAEVELKARNVNHARNVYDRAVTLLPRVDTVSSALHQHNTTIPTPY